MEDHRLIKDHLKPDKSVIGTIIEEIETKILLTSVTTKTKSFKNTMTETDEER
jgi:hypothetical protein